MKYRLIIRGDFQEELKGYFYPDREDSLERFAVVFLSLSKSRRMRTLVPAKLLLPEDEDYERRSNTGLKIKDEFVHKYWKFCEKNHYFPMTVHSHPFQEGRSNFFSGIDDTSDRRQLEFFGPMLSNGFYVTGVMNRVGILTCRFFEIGFPDRPQRPFDEVFYCDFPLRKEFPAQITKDSSEIKNGIYDRQVRAFGKEGQELMGKMRACLAGVGGLGSVLVEILARLGVSDFTLIDHDIAESTNLNRFTGMYQSDVERKMAKVKIARRLIRKINPSAKVRFIETEVYSPGAVDVMKQADIIFLSTDNVTSRYFVNQFCIQYLVPCISMGSVIEYNKRLEKITAILGEVVLMVPGASREKFCLVCSGAINTDLLKLENAPDNLTERLRGYIRGDEEPAPAVRYLNGLVANLAVAEFHNLVCGFKEPEFYQQINLMPKTTFYDDFFEDDFLEFLEYLKSEGIITSANKVLQTALKDDLTVFDEEANRRRLFSRVPDEKIEEVSDIFISQGIVKNRERFLDEIKAYFIAEPCVNERIIDPIDVSQQEDNCYICGPKAFDMAQGDLAELKRVSY